MRGPRVILADEPTGNLDERTRDEIVALLEELWGGSDQTIIMVTHDSRVAARAERTGIMRDGRLSVAATSPDVGALRPGTERGRLAPGITLWTCLAVTVWPRHRGRR